jgi:uncharacterized membrane protein
MPILFQYAHKISPEFVTVLLAALPVSELRGAIPYAMTVGGMGWQKAFALSVVGNFLPVLPILLLLEAVSNRLRRYRQWDRFFTWLFERTRRRGRLVERFEALGLVLFVAVPLPITGAWTGCVAAFIFKIPLKLALPAILCGILIAGTVVTLASLGMITVWGI